MKKKLIITIDTEGDNLWKNKITKYGLKEITTENAEKLIRFQILCEKYQFIPTYLVNYEMSQSKAFVDFAKAALKDRKCEIGMHMHAWNSPPVIDLPYNPKGFHPYLGEYAHKVQWRKMLYLKETLEDTFQIPITSHRGGRWYLDEFVLKCLKKLGIYVDCSVTPGISWGNAIGNRRYGSDYLKDKYNGAYMLSCRNIHKKGNSGVYEVPPTILARYKISLFDIKKEMIWLRPNGKNLDDMIWVQNQIKANHHIDYIEFMIHSSELAANKSPYFPTDRSICKLYKDLEILFSELKKNFEGISLTGYVDRKYRLKQK